jgi:hypothetical protein
LRSPRVRATREQRLLPIHFARVTQRHARSKTVIA